MVKWQDIAKYAGGGTLGIFLVLAGILNMTGMTYTTPDDQNCMDCYDAVYVNSTIWEIKAEHAGDKDIVFAKRMRSRTRWVNLDKIDEFVDTSPSIPVEILVPTVKRYATVNHPEYGYLRPIKDGDSLVERKNQKYNPDGDWFVIHGQTGGRTVKWGMSLDDWLMKDLSFDPIWSYGASGSNNLIIHLKMNGDALDSSGNGNDATNSGMKVVPGRFGLAYEGNAATNRIIMPTVFALDEYPNGTMSFWANFVDSGGFIVAARSGGDTRIYMLQQANGDVELTMGTSSVLGDIKSTALNDTWYHFVVTWNSTHANGYADGVKTIDSGSYTVAGGTDTRAFSLGAYTDGSTYSDTIFDEFRLYDRTFSDAEVLEFYNETKVSHANQFYGGSDVSVVNNDDLSMHLDLDGDALDSSGNGNDATNIGGTIIPGKFGLAYHFDGTTYIKLTNSTNLVSSGGSITMNAWVKTENVGAGNDRIITLMRTSTGDASVGSGLTLQQKSSEWASFLYDGSAAWLQSSVTPTTDWTMVTTTTNTTWHRMYVNGELVAGTARGAVQIGTDSGYVANYAGACSGSYCFTGNIDDVRVYNTSFNEAEVLRLYNETKSSHSNQFYGASEEDSVDSDNLVLQLKMNGNALDSSGQGNDGSTSGDASVVPAKFGLGYDFDGDGDRLTVADDSTLRLGSGNFSISIWFKTTDVNVPIIDKYTAVAGGQYHMRIISGYLEGSVWDSDNSTGSHPISTTAVYDGEWHFGVFVMESDGITGKLYLDGVLEDTDVSTVRDTDGLGDLWIGQNRGASALNGTMDEFRIYNSSLSAAQVRQLYNETKSSHSKLFYGSPEEI